MCVAGSESWRWRAHPPGAVRVTQREVLNGEMSDKWYLFGTGSNADLPAWWLGDHDGSGERSQLPGSTEYLVSGKRSSPWAMEFETRHF